jgi:hypothetical protein
MNERPKRCFPVQVNPFAVVSAGLCPPLVPVMNSLVSSHEVVMERPGPEFLSPLGILPFPFIL